MTTAGLDALTVEIQFTSGVWTNVTPDVDLSAELTITHPRFVLGESAQSMTLDLSMRNIPDGFGISKYTPDNPMSPFYPNVTRDKPIRVVATRGASTWTRFSGFIDRWTPDASDGEPTTQRVQVTASGILARYARRTLLAQYQERLLDMAVQQGRAVDMWPIDDGESPTVLRNVGVNATGTTAGVVAGKVVQATGSMTGQANFSTPDGGLLLSSTAAFTRSDTGNAAAPVLKLQLQNAGGMSRISLWAKVDQPPVNYDDMVCGYDRGGKCLWRMGPVETVISGGATRTDIAFCGPSGNVISTVNVGDANDGAWRWLSLLFDDTSGGTWAFAIRTKNVPDAIVASGNMPNDSNGDRINGRDTRFVVVGGYMSPRNEGSQLNSFMGSVAGIYAMHGTFGDTSWSDRASPDTVTTADVLRGDYIRYGVTLDALTGGAVSSIGDTTPVCYTNAGTRTLLDLWSELATTTGGLLTETPPGKRYYRAGKDCRPTTVSFTLDAQRDAQGGPVWEQIERPTRVTATSPNGGVTVINSAAETATGMQSDASIDTAAATADYAAQVAGFVLRQGDGLRLAQISIDLTTAENDLWAAFMGAGCGDRGRLTGLPVGHYGASYVEFFLDGWTEVHAPDSVTFTLDTIAADAPPKAITDDSEYGRTGVEGATVTGGTCIATTGTGTIVVTSPVPFTSSAGDYPASLSWNGERITVNAPGGSTSPQTFTVTARGVAPAGARAHTSGEAIDVWHAATVAF